MKKKKNASYIDLLVSQYMEYVAKKDQEKEEEIATGLKNAILHFEDMLDKWLPIELINELEIGKPAAVMDNKHRQVTAHFQNPEYPGYILWRESAPVLVSTLPAISASRTHFYEKSLHAKAVEQDLTACATWKFELAELSLHFAAFNLKKAEWLEEKEKQHEEGLRTAENRLSNLWKYEDVEEKFNEYVEAFPDPKDVKRLRKTFLECKKSINEREKEKMEKEKAQAIFQAEQEEIQAEKDKEYDRLKEEVYMKFKPYTLYEITYTAKTSSSEQYYEDECPESDIYFSTCISLHQHPGPGDKWWRVVDRGGIKLMRLPHILSIERIHIDDPFTSSFGKSVRIDSEKFEHLGITYYEAPHNYSDPLEKENA